MKYDVYGVGNALVDYLVSVDDNYLRDNQIEKGVMTLSDQPAVDLAESAGQAVTRASGGSAANTVVGVVALGGTACYSGRVGDDELGSFYVDDLRKIGVPFFGDRETTATGSCVSLISEDGERSMITFLGASRHLSQEDIRPDEISNCRFLYIEGYVWDSATGREAAVFAMEEAKRAGTKVAFSLSDPFLVGRYQEDLTGVIREYVDILFCNEQEAAQITNCDTTAAAIEKLAVTSPLVCVTLGAEGALVADGTRMRATPPLTVAKVVDTTGAGDLYAAGVLRGLSLDFDIVTSSMIGARLAAAIVEQIGARLPS